MVSVQLPRCELLLERGFVTQRSFVQPKLVVVWALALAALAAGPVSAAESESAAREEEGAAGEEESADAEEQRARVDEALEAEGLPLREHDPTVDALMTELLTPLVDEIAVNGVLLPGRVLRLSAGGLVVETNYGEGTIEIPYASIDALETVRSYRVLYGIKEKVHGRLLGIEDGHLLVGATRLSATRVPVDSIQRGVSDEEYETRNLTRIRTDLRYWSAAFDLGMNLESGAIEKRKVNFGLDVDRARAPWLFSLDARYAFESQQRVDETEPQTTKDEFWGALRLQYDFWKRASVFGAFPGEFDTPRGVEIRIYPNAGLGYMVWESDRILLELQGGFGYVFEEFRDFGSNDYASALIGFRSEFRLPRNAVIEWWLYYLPGLVDSGSNWLFRSEFDLRVPIWDPLALLFRVTDVYDNNPSELVGNNKVVTTLGFSLNF